MIAIRVLFVEDAEIDVDLGASCLRNAGFEPEIRVAEDEASLVRLLRSWSPDVVVSDLSLPRFSGVEAFEAVRSHAPHVPFIFRSGGIRSRSAQEAIARGACGHVEKGDESAFVALVIAAVQDRQQR